MNDTFDVVTGIDNWEIGEAGFVEFVENEGAEDLFAIDEDHFGFLDHELSDRASVKTHNGGDAVAIHCGED